MCYRYVVTYYVYHKSGKVLQQDRVTVIIHVRVDYCSVYKWVVNLLFRWIIAFVLIVKSIIPLIHRYWSYSYSIRVVFFMLLIFFFFSFVVWFLFFIFFFFWGRRVLGGVGYLFLPNWLMFSKRLHPKRSLSQMFKWGRVGVIIGFSLTWQDVKYVQDVL